VTFPTRQSLAAVLDATLLRADASDQEVREVSRAARRDGCAAVCVMPARLEAAARELATSTTRVAAAISFPLGASTPAGKHFEALEAIRLGAVELDVVLDLDAVRRGDVDALEREMARIMEQSPEAVHKFIVEIAWLPAAAMKRLGRAARRLRPAFLKTGTGFNAGPVTVEQVARLREAAGADVGVKAAGGIRTLEQAASLVGAGASRLGTSRSVELIAEWDACLAGKQPL
jgi:deoxyribose-phosphate aldolase